MLSPRGPPGLYGGKSAPSRARSQQREKVAVGHAGARRVNLRSKPSNGLPICTKQRYAHKLRQVYLDESLILPADLLRFPESGGRSAGSNPPGIFAASSEPPTTRFLGPSNASRRFCRRRLFLIHSFLTHHELGPLVDLVRLGQEVNHHPQTDQEDAHADGPRPVQNHPHIHFPPHLNQ